MSSVRVVLGSASAAALLAACGSSGLSKTDFLKKADAICVGVRQQLDTLPVPSVDSTLAEVATYLGHSIQFNQDAVSKVHALTPPSDDQAAVARVLDDFDAVIAKAKVAQQKAAAGDATAADVAMKEIDPAVERASTDAKQYGFTSCGQRGAAGSASPGPR